MPVQVSYPGVYVEELPSGVRTIVGVATAITAFVGRAPRGSVAEPVVVNGLADAEREFGGLWSHSNLGYAIRDFFLNGGGQAIVIRLYRPKAGKTGVATLSVGNLDLVARTPGAWGNRLQASILPKPAADVAEAVAADLGVDPGDIFDLRVVDEGGGTEETFRNLTVKDTRRRVDRVLQTSQLVRWDGAWPTPDPVVTTGDDPQLDPVTEARVALREAEEDSPGAEQKLAAAKQAADQAEAELDAAKAETPPDPAKIAEAQKKHDDAQAALTAAETEAAPVVAARAALKTALGGQTGDDGEAITSAEFLPQNGSRDKKGLYALEKADLFNLLCVPPYKAGENGGDVDPTVITAAARYCEVRRAMLLLDPPSNWATVQQVIDGRTAIGTTSANAALYFPRLQQADPLRDNRISGFAGCGSVAGIMARTDTERGVWKAPAGLAATISGAAGLAVPLTDPECGRLNPLGVNCLLTKALAGPVVWGARTMQGADGLASQWKYVPVRRLALYIEESLFRGTQWVVFEPNDEPLWAQVRLNIGAFMHDLFRQGAFQGATPNEAYLVKVDRETTTQTDINLGILNIVVGFAPLKPAEFVILRIKQLAGQIET